MDVTETEEDLVQIQETPTDERSTDATDIGVIAVIEAELPRERNVRLISKNDRKETSFEIP